MVKPEKRDEIVRAALGLIAENGFHGAPMAMIADRAGVGAGTIYRYFENKDVLINELYQELEERVFSVIMNGYEQSNPLQKRFIHLGTALLHHFISNPIDYRYLEQFHNSPYGAEVRRDKVLGKREGCNIFRDIFEEGISSQSIKNLPLLVLFALAFGPILAVTRDHVLGFINLDDQLIAQTIEACWDAVSQ